MPFYRDITAPSAATEYLNRFSGDHTPAYPARCWFHRPPHTARVRHINPSTAHPILSVLGSSPHAENRLPPQWSREAVLGRHTAYLRSPLRLSHPLMQAVFRGQRRLNLQDSNLRSLPLPVKRRSPPRPRFRMPPSIPGCQLRGLWSTSVYCPHRALFAAWVVRPPGPDLWTGFQPCGISRRYCRHGRGRIRRGKRSMEYASILGRMCTCLLHIFFASFFIIPQYLVFVNQIIDFYINILCF